MEVNKNQAEVNWQYPMVHKYQAEANKCLKRAQMEVNMNQAEVNWHYAMVRGCQAEGGGRLGVSPSERRRDTDRFGDNLCLH